MQNIVYIIETGLLLTVTMWHNLLKTPVSKELYKLFLQGTKVKYMLKYHMSD